MAETAPEIRSRILKARTALSAEEREVLGWTAIENFLSGPGDKVKWTGLKVGLFRAFRSELDLTPLAVTLEEEGALLHAPRGVGDTLELVRVPAGKWKVESAVAGAGVWKRSPLGFEEPDPSWPVVPASELDWVFVPGSAFGEHGERIGRGMGHYDRFLAGCPRAVRAAIVFDLQILPSLPQEPWDQPMHHVVSDKRCFSRR